MMFEKPYYTLEEAAKKIGFDIEDILYCAANGEITISIPPLIFYREEMIIYL